MTAYTAAIAAKSLPLGRTANVKVDVMGGKTGAKGYINYDQQATSGIADDMSNFSKYFRSNSVDQMVANNPMAPFLEQVTPALKQGSTITIRGQFKNKNFANIWDKSSIEGCQIISRTRNISSKGYFKSNGKPIQGGMNEIILKKN